jgi:YgiT-type zinc finger domain-containing protein
MIEEQDFCEFCDGVAEPARVRHTFERKGKEFQYENIAALKCNECGAVYLDGVAVERIEKEIAEFNLTSK